MDEFAQSREDDDLFADEFEPVVEPVVVVETKSQETSESTTPTTGGSTDTSASSNTPTGPAGQSNARGAERRGAGRGDSSRGGGLSSSRYATAEDNTKPDATKTNTSPSSPPPSDPSTTPIQSTATSETTTNTVASPNPVPQPPSRPTAVRGDRHLTGGPAHKKLTEEELTEKMERMKILNAQKAERFRLSEEDSAAYARKEKEMEKKRVEELKNSRAMDMERAKNRQRKLQAQSGREWDSEKLESDIVDGRSRGRSSEFVRGGHGGVIRNGGLGASRYATADDESAEGRFQASRGRGGGFEIRGRGGNRGGRGGGGRGGKPKSPASVPGPEDFPELPTPNKPPTTEDVKLPSTDKLAGDWADEMSTPVEEKKLSV